VRKKILKKIRINNISRLLKAGFIFAVSLQFLNLIYRNLHSGMKIKYNYVVIEGNIGAGKTTLAARIADQFNAHLVLEHFADNPFLPKFYSDPEKYSFPLELSFWQADTSS